MSAEALSDKPESAKQGISIPKPDYHYGYNVAAFESTNIDALEHSGKYARPSTTSFLPFFAVELKSQARGGTMWVAENQNAGSGALFVHCFERVIAWNGQNYWETLKEDKTNYSEVDSVAFSCCIDATTATLWIHWHQKEKYNSAKFGSYWLNESKDIRRLYSAISHIIEYGLTTRLDQVKHAVHMAASEQELENRGTRKPKRKASN
ncbi:hypothetical protein MMC34_004487 [Xylographa carneopallida]|nr:hypothetical protein [Xylographa carneopallida]